MSFSADKPFNSDNAATNEEAALVVAPTPTTNTNVVALTPTTNTNAVAPHQLACVEL